MFHAFFNLKFGSDVMLTMYHLSRFFMASFEKRIVVVKRVWFIYSVIYDR